MRSPDDAVRARRETEAPRWAKASAWIAASTPWPSAAYRVALIARGAEGLPPTYGQDQLAFVVHTSLISLVSCLAAFLTVGLVSPWSQVVPGWIPWAGGRRIDPRPVFVAAVAGATLAAAFAAYALSGLLGRFEGGPPDVVAYLDRQYGVVMTCYAPLALWGPLLLLVSLDFYNRRIRTDAAG